jgi:hypothetical protein
MGDSENSWEESEDTGSWDSDRALSVPDYDTSSVGCDVYVSGAESDELMVNLRHNRIRARKGRVRLERIIGVREMSDLEFIDCLDEVDPLPAGPQMPHITPCGYFKQFLREEMPDSYLRNERDYVNVRSTTEQQLRHLAQYNRAPHEFDPKVWADITQQIDEWFEAAGTVQISTNVEDVVLEMDTSPGYTYKKHGFKSKGDAWPARPEGGGASTEAQRMVEALHAGRKIDPHWSYATGRSKRTRYTKLESAERDGSFKPFGRLIQACDVRDVAVAQLWLAPWNRKVTEADYGLALGKSFFNKGGQYYAEYFSLAQDVLGIGLDASKYDANFPTRVAEYIFEKLRSHTLTEEGRPLSEQYRDFCVEMHCHPKIVTPLGDLVQLHHGLCTGASFTSLIESIGTWALVRVATARAIDSQDDVTEILRSIKFRIQTLGDDSFATMLRRAVRPNGEPYSVEDCVSLDVLSAYSKENFGIPISSEKSMRGYGYEAFEFLGKKINRRNEPTRQRVLKTALSLKYPERPVKSGHHAYTRAVGLLIDNALSTGARKLCYKYLVWLQRRLDVSLAGIGGRELQAQARQNRNASWYFWKFATEEFISNVLTMLEELSLERICTSEGLAQLYFAFDPECLSKFRPAEGYANLFH